MASDYSVVVADATRLDDVGPLFKSMVEHHRTVSGQDWPVRDADAAWDRRRREYVGWLAEGRTWLLLAVSQTSPQDSPAGYAMVRLTEPGPTWDLGEVVGDLESLAVADDARGGGIGTILMDAARDLLRARGARFWSVGVVEANDGAVRLYERNGFRPYYREMLGRV
jgi:ribosomal protein S18 acetylase RimI-like enzyme